MASNTPYTPESMATNTAVRTPLDQPSLSWRMSSSFILGATSMLCRGFLYGLNTVETTGLDRFLELLDKRKDVDKRERGLITAVVTYRMDDPIMWGILPARYAFNPTNLRWGLGAHDICFKNKALSTFFSLGQVLPTHRASYSPHGGAFQATIPQAIRLLSAQPFGSLQPGSLDEASSKALGAADIHDPFTSGDGLTYSTDGNDSFVAPSIYAQNRLAWVHIFPEGCIHQHQSMTMRYFKWGVARLILESEPMPDMLPMFIDGTQNIMSEERTFPRFLPRGGHKFHITFGELLDMEATFGDLRRKWQELVRKDRLRALGKAENDASAKTWSSNSPWASLSSLWPSKSSSTSTPETTVPPSSSSSDSDSPLQLQQQSTTLQSRKRTSGQLAMGELSEELKYGAEAQALRIEVARRVRDEIEKLRVSLGYPEDDPKLALAETWAKEPAGARRFKSEVDGSLVTKE
ncbi:Bctaz1 [Apiospora aurea]|uniref:Tafazzin family protein n=1 Tax=Apiospora aurea TaxID=335848 RepID=A0ABR1QWB4_9PEZI